jgi:UDP-2,4-diacetamido-2,4,6-trideoxy-beta-L-altropyranose hydrolase
MTLMHAFASFGHSCVLVARQLDVPLNQFSDHKLFETRPLPAPDPSSRFQVELEIPHSEWARVEQGLDAEQTIAILSDQKIDLMLVDHYSFSATWHDMVRKSLGCRVIVVDDVADRSLSADFVIDQNYADSHERKYSPWLIRPSRLLCGPRFAMLAPVYRDCPRFQVGQTVRRLGVFMGGVDPFGYTRRVLSAIQESGFIGEITVVSTTSNPDLQALVGTVAEIKGARLELDLPDLHQFFSSQDLVIGAGGGSTWERCAVGVPSISCIFAENHWSVLEPLSRLGVTRVVDVRERFDLVEDLRMLLNSREIREDLACASQSLVDGRGTERIVQALNLN